MTYRSRAITIGGTGPARIGNGIVGKSNPIMEEIMATAQANAESKKTEQEIEVEIKKIDKKILKLESQYKPVLSKGSNQPKATLTDAMNQRKQADILRAHRTKLVAYQTSITLSVQQRSIMNMTVKMKNVHSKNVTAAEKILKHLDEDELMTLQANAEGTQESIDNAMSNVERMTKDIDRSIMQSAMQEDYDEDDEYTQMIKEELKETDKRNLRMQRENDGETYEEEEQEEEDDFMARILEKARIIAESSE